MDSFLDCRAHEVTLAIHNHEVSWLQHPRYTWRTLSWRMSSTKRHLPAHLEIQGRATVSSGDHQLRRSPADPAWVPRQQWRALDGGWQRRRRRRRWLRLDTDTRRLLLLTWNCDNLLNLNVSFLGELLHLNSIYIILGVQRRLKPVKGTFPLLSRWGKNQKVKTPGWNETNTLPAPDYFKANTEIGCNFEFRSVKHTNSLSRAP